MNSRMRGTETYASPFFKYGLPRGRKSDLIKEISYNITEKIELNNNQERSLDRVRKVGGGMLNLATIR